MRSERRSPPVGAGEIPPVAWKRQTQRMALAMLTPKRLAAALRDRPPTTTASTTRVRRSSDSAIPAASFTRRRPSIIDRPDSGIPCDSFRWETALEAVDHLAHHRRVFVEQFRQDGEIVVVDDGVDPLADGGELGFDHV